MILIIGGTEDSIILGSFLEEKGYNIYISAATSYGKDLITKHGLKPFRSRLCGDKMHKILEDNNIKAVIDASHPYSINVTSNTKAACDKCDIPLIRFERPRTKLQGQKAKENISYVKDFDEAAKKAFSLGDRVLLTTGSNNLEPFVTIRNSLLTNKNYNKDEYTFQPKLYARILPEKDSIIKCQELGLTPDEIIAIKGPLNYNLNKAIIENYNISVIVTKDSGESGGTPEKIHAALDLDINIVIIDRPVYKDILTTHSKEEILDWISNIT
ncbi:precorrin-6A reductase [Natranaerofaba carboxydovora]|uniref:precorrin-6A reductase n=1 Tax=Natranaerofaba carboxydovora TaxID=2742683 RepID=UPI001F12F5F6|nr:precorrin-6A reductase [Natranaerofaba carboxydovora]UMZ73134.1 Cobalt-precorrin-6A reductase [Natranaerofaba carboxydovora]